MLVDVVELRRRGEKLSRDEVRAAQPVRGELMLHNIRPGTTYWRARQRPLQAGLLRPGTYEWALPPLDYACVTRIRPGRGMTIAGFQETGLRKATQIHPQVWWARPVTAAMPETAASSPSADAPVPDADRDRTTLPPATG